ncbi:hypothetical protein ACH46N_14275 [Streptomyces pristinaespiralis]|uniref:Uncharacterized protein n=1 Tax=Streptomyces pristinaespiralis TaxID=38300 RepID=A0A0M4DD55_STRPR|nr:hypothetical protein [Streptomyces pristinaespiralis]ALC20210.1 hypothetical protein SPRI_1904 [Streptomyces pristinaespiralis]QMU16903.1 hypothetical protein H3L99_27480 [Streptomyces pristinaespiralis]
MDQQIDPKTKLDIAVGTDPAFVPVLSGPAPAVKEREEESTATGPDAGAGPDDAPDEADDAETDATAGTTDGDDEPTDEATDDSDDPAIDGPAFEVRDRRGSIAADSSGIRFTLDDQEADFRWDEIGAVEVRPARFGRRFTVTVHVAANRWFNADVEAPARGRLKEWTEELDAVLDAYFEEA